MRRQCLKISVASVALISALAPAMSAEIFVNVFGGYTAESITYTGTEENPDSSTGTVVGANSLDRRSRQEFTLAPGSLTVSDGFSDQQPPYDASADASASADTATGAMKMQANVAVDVRPLFIPGSDETSVSTIKRESYNPSSSLSTPISGFASISETFTVNGTGTAAFNALVDLEWSGQTNFLFEIIGNNETTDEFYFSNENVRINTFSDPFEGSVSNQLAELEIDFNDAVGEILEIEWRMLGQVEAFDACFVVDGCPDFGLSSQAMVDALNTANIFFTGSDGLSVTPTSSGFLSESRVQTYSPTPAAVPLPATAWLMMSALAGLFGVGWLNGRQQRERLKLRG